MCESAEISPDVLTVQPMLSLPTRRWQPIVTVAYNA